MNMPDENEVIRNNCAIDKVFSVLRGRFAPKKCFNEILKICMEYCDTISMGMYQLSEADSNYYLITSLGPSSFESEIPISAIDRYSDNQFLIRTTKDMTIGWIEVPLGTSFKAYHRIFLTIVCNILSREFEKEWIHCLFSEIVKPVDLNLAEKDFYNTLNMLACQASNMKYSALRTYNEDAKEMQCLALCAKNQDTSDIDLKDLSMHESEEHFNAYYKVMMGETDGRVMVYSNGDLIEFVKSKHLIFADLRTVIIARLSIGEISIGTLSLGVNHKTNFTTTQKKGLTSLANHISAALSNYQEHMRSNQYYADIMTKFKETMNQELIQGLRHSAKNSLFTVEGKIRNLLSQQIVIKDSELKENIEKLQFHTKFAQEAINDQAKVIDFGKPQFEEIDLRRVFEDAKVLMNFRLSKNRIDVISNNKESIAIVDANSLKYAFLNLILNSIDALKLGPKSNRKITLNIEEHSDRYKMIYSDNGVGFRPNNQMNVIEVNDVWLPGRTTKKNGTGYGLTYARDAIQKINGGTINIINYRNGFSFEIYIWKDSASHTKF